MCCVTRDKFPCQAVCFPSYFPSEVKNLGHPNHGKKETFALAPRGWGQKDNWVQLPATGGLHLFAMGRLHLHI